ncbi:hypothetical protein D3C85_1649310 [compost metagenome]
MLSEIQPKNGRVSPFSTRSMVSAKVSAGSVSPRMDTGESWSPKSLAMGPSCTVAISPPAAIITNIAYITQKIGEDSTWRGDAL